MNKVTVSMQAINDDGHLDVFAATFPSWDNMFENFVSTVKETINRHGLGRTFTKIEIDLFDPNKLKK